MKGVKSVWLSSILMIWMNSSVYALPNGFVYLEDVDSSIIQDLKYVTDFNFMGRQVKGYESGHCILTKSAAEHLHNAQVFLNMKGYSFKVYDCYRPTRAVDDFVAWSKDKNDQTMKAIKYPRINKKDIFKLGYVAYYSGHSRGSTVDLTIIPMKSQTIQKDNEHNRSCLKPSFAMQHANELDMGSDYDCLDSISHVDSAEISGLEKRHRLWLQSIMIRNGFHPYDKEWWHFTLADEPYPNQYFNFPVT